jgi:hypothetical protein
MRFRSFLGVFILLIATITLWADEDKTARTDERLDQKVTYQAKGELLHKVIEELSTKTGVEMTCGNNAKDWQVRDRKVTIFVKDMPLKELQQVLADVMHFTWLRGAKDGAYIYRLSADLKTRKEEELLRAEAKEAKAKEAMEKRQSAIDDLTELVSMKPEDIEELRAKSPLRYFMAKEPIGKAVAKMIQTIPEVHSAILEGRECTIDLANASPETVDVVKAYTGAYTEFGKRVGAPHISNSTENDIRTAKIKINNGFDELQDSNMPEMMGRSFVGMINIEDSDGHEVADMPIFNLESPMAKMIGKALVQASEGIPIEELDEQMGKELEQSMREEMLKEQKCELLPTDPDLEKQLKLDSDKSEPGLPSLLEKISKKTEFQIVADHFRDPFSHFMMEAMIPVKTQGTVNEVLVSVASSYEKKVQKTDKLVTFIDDKWFEKRAWEVSEDQLTLWKDKIRNGTLTFDDIVDMACVTDEQLSHTLIRDSSLSPISYQAQRNRHILRLYSLLNPMQKRALKTPAGLDVLSLTARQLPYFEALLHDRHSLVKDKKDVNPNAPYVITLEADSEERNYTFYLRDLSAVPPTDIETVPNDDTEVEPGDDVEIDPTVDYDVVGRWSLYIPPTPSDEPEGMYFDDEMPGDAPDSDEQSFEEPDAGNKSNIE